MSFFGLIGQKDIRERAAELQEQWTLLLIENDGVTALDSSSELVDGDSC